MPQGFRLTRTIAVLVAFGLRVVPELSAGELTTLQIRASDGQQQPARCYFPKNTTDQPIPLLVVLHSWSAGYEQTGFVEDCLAECERRTWGLIHPHFQGQNIRPEACASERAVKDVLDAVAFARKQTKIDPRRIYLVGASGGGHMSLIMVGRHPQIWAGVSAWVPISDLKAWHAQTTERKLKYRSEMEVVCGGKPGDSAAVDKQYRDRSPLTWLEQAKEVTIDINAGIDDGHTGSVPVSQSLLAFNLLAKTNGREDLTFTPGQIEAVTLRREIAPAIAFVGPAEPERKHKILIRRVAGSARVTIFEGGHEGDMPTAVRWLSQQVRKP